MGCWYTIQTPVDEKHLQKTSIQMTLYIALGAFFEEGSVLTAFKKPHFVMRFPTAIVAAEPKGLGKTKTIISQTSSMLQNAEQRFMSFRWHFVLLSVQFGSFWS